MRIGYVAAVVLVLAITADADGPRVPTGPLVTSERWPRTTDLRAWTRDVMRLEGLEDASETAQAKAFFEWLRLFCRMAVGGMIQAHEGEYGRERYVLDAHKNLFVYGWGYCDTCSRVADAAWKEFKRDPSSAARVVVANAEGGYHTMYRLRLDGRYAAFDPRYGYYLLDRDAADARILDWAEVGDDKHFHANKAYQHRSRPYFEYAIREWDRALRLQPVYFESQREWEKAGSPKASVFGDSHYQMGTRFHDMNFRLPAGMKITRFWDSSARAYYGPVSQSANREFPFLPSGRFYRVTDKMFDGNWPKHDPNFQRVKPYLATVPHGQGYDPEMEGGRTIGQAWGRIEYEPDLSNASIRDALEPGATLVPSSSAPHLRPVDPQRGGSAVFDVYSPYVLVDGTIDAAVSGNATLEMRVLQAKARDSSEPDVWSAWQGLDVSRSTSLGRARFNGKQASIHGAYRFQLRVSVPGGAGGSASGLNRIRLSLMFENGLMSLPQIFDGTNRVRVEMRDSSLLRAPVEVVYLYQTAQGQQQHRQVLKPADFTSGTASYVIQAPGLLRCDSVSIAHHSAPR